MEFKLFKSSHDYYEKKKPMIVKTVSFIEQIIFLCTNNLGTKIKILIQNILPM